MRESDQSGSGTKVVLIVLGAVGAAVLLFAAVVVVGWIAITSLGTSANATFAQVGTKTAIQPAPVKMETKPGPITKQTLPKQAAQPGPEVGTQAPEIEGEDIDGKKFKLSDYRGKVVMLDFWGHW